MRSTAKTRYKKGMEQGILNKKNNQRYPINGIHYPGTTLTYIDKWVDSVYSRFNISSSTFSHAGMLSDTSVMDLTVSTVS